jgi:hypothetical protein
MRVRTGRFTEFYRATARQPFNTQILQDLERQFGHVIDPFSSAKAWAKLNTALLFTHLPAAKRKTGTPNHIRYAAPAREMCS